MGPVHSNMSCWTAGAMAQCTLLLIPYRTFSFLSLFRFEQSNKQQQQQSKPNIPVVLSHSRQWLSRSVSRLNHDSRLSLGNSPSQPLKGLLRPNFLLNSSCKVTRHRRFQACRHNLCLTVSTISISESRSLSVWPYIGLFSGKKFCCHHSRATSVFSSTVCNVSSCTPRKLYDYIRYDLKEIAFPSSLPNPPNLKTRRKLTWEQRIWVLKRATRLYAASWVRDIGPDLRPNDYKTDEPNAIKETAKNKEPSILEELAVAARGGMETLRPALQRVYMTRASAYRDAMKSFIEGYQEGVLQVVEKENSKTEENADASKKST